MNVDEKIEEFWKSGARGYLKHCLEIHKPSCDDLEWNAKETQLAKSEKTFNLYIKAAFFGKDVEKQKKEEEKAIAKEIKQVERDIKKLERQKKKGKVPIK